MWFFPIFALALPVGAIAGDCYLVDAYGSGTYRRNTAKLESKLLSLGRSGTYQNHRYAIRTTGSYSIDQTSRPYHLGLGCELNEHWTWEIDYRRGFQMAINSRLGLSGHIDGRTFETRQVAFQERFDMDGIGLSIIGTHAIGRGFSLTGRLGVMRARVRLSIALPDEQARLTVKEERGNLPIVGLGLVYRPFRNWSFAAEAVKYNGESKILSLIVRRRINFL